MNAKLSLHVPGLKEMTYRQQLLAQPETMSYNRGQLIDAPGYDVATGCIDFPMADWRYWRDVWLWHEPNRFSAYLKDETNDRFVGEVCYYYDMEADMHAAAIIIEGKHRNQGYGAAGMKLLAERAFAQEDIDALYADVPMAREDAVRMYLTAGFREEHVEGGICRMVLHKEVEE